MKNTPSQQMQQELKHHAWWIVLRLFFQKNARALLLGCLLATSTIVMGCALLGISGWFITSTAIAGLATGTAIMFDVFTPSASIRLLALGRTASRYGERMFTHDATLTVLVRLREKLFLGWSAPEAARQLFLRPSRLLFRLTRDLDALENLYLRLLVPLSAAISASLLVSLIGVNISPWLGLLALIWLLLSGLVTVWWMSQRSILHSAKHALALEKLRAKTIDLVAGQTDLIMTGRLRNQRERVLLIDQQLSKADSQLNQVEVRGCFVLTLMQSLNLAGALGIGALLLKQGLLNAPMAALLVLLVLAAAEPFAGLRRGAIEAGKTWLSARRLVAPLSQADQNETSTKTFATPAANELAVEARNITYEYLPATDQLHCTLRDLNLNISTGDHVALVGHSGSGKSTLLALIAGELSPQQGSVHAQKSVWLTQRTELFQDSVRANLNLRDEPLTDAQLWSALEAAGLANDIRRTEKGLNTLLGEGGMGLSGGQARRLALARLFLAPETLWLLDEPTEGLDAETAADVLRSIKLQAKKKTLIVATHLQREAQLAERAILMEGGQITAAADVNDDKFAALVRSLRTG